VHIIEGNIFDKKRHVIQGHSRSLMGKKKKYAHFGRYGAKKTKMLILDHFGGHLEVILLNFE